PSQAPSSLRTRGGPFASAVILADARWPLRKRRHPCGREDPSEKQAHEPCALGSSLAHTRVRGNKIPKLAAPTEVSHESTTEYLSRRTRRPRRRAKKMTRAAPGASTRRIENNSC